MGLAKNYITCFICKRDFELNKNDETGKMWGECPVCKTRYLIEVKKKEKN